MRFKFSKANLKARDKKLQRLFEIIPGLTSWGILLGLVFISIFFPFTGAIIIICFYLFWLLRLLYMTIFLILSYIQLNKASKTDWNKKITELNFNQDIYHIVMFPILKESKQIIEPAIIALKEQSFSSKNTIVVFALEERATEKIQHDVTAICEKYKPHFLDCLTIIHPANIPGEARVKGANVTFAARQMEQYAKDKNIALDQIIISCFDADTVVSRNYFACLTYHFMSTPDRLLTSFQPIPMYHNNIWQVPGFARVIEIGSSFFQLIEATNPEKLVTFSSHSMSFKALVDVDYWPVDMISDDSAIFWKCFIHYNGRYRVVPMYVTLSMDVVCSNNLLNTIKSVYKQKRRWAWGVENFPLVMRAFLKNNNISLYDKIRHSFKLFENHISWATWGFLLSVIGWLPALFARHEFSSSVVYYNVPEIANTIFNLASLCLLISIVLSILLLPKTTLKYSLLVKAVHVVEWLLIPFIFLFFGALPALDAQTRLMFGRYLEFWVTDKHRKEKRLKD